MNSRKILTLMTLTLTLASILWNGPTLFPRINQAHAITCPTGGSSNACLSVSLDAISKPTLTATAQCDVQAAYSQNGVCDTLINTSASNSTTFRVGAILNATSGNRALAVFGWQFAINYDPTLVHPQGDPSPVCVSYSDCGEKTVWLGTQKTAGTVNWASYVATNSAGVVLGVTEDPLTPHTGQIIVAFVFFAPSPPVDIFARTVLASVAFELVAKGTATLTISDVIFSDMAATQLPGIIAASASPCTPLYCGSVTDTTTNDPPHANFVANRLSDTSWMFDSIGSTDSDGTIPDPGGYYWDFGDGTQDLGTSGSVVIAHNYATVCNPTCPNGAAFPGIFTVTLRVVDDKGATGTARDYSGSVINNGQPSHTSNNVLADFKPTALFTASPSITRPGQTVSFDASASLDSDGTITDPAGYKWSFGDSATGSGKIVTHSFSAVGSYQVNLTVTDNNKMNATIVHTVIVTNPPSLQVTAPSIGTTGTQVTISLTTSAALPGTLTVKVDWGDGTVDTLPAGASSATHSYATAKGYTITVTSTDNYGQSTMKTQAIDVTALGTGSLFSLTNLAIIAAVVLVVVLVAGYGLLRRRKKPVAIQ